MDNCKVKNFITAKQRNRIISESLSQNIPLHTCVPICLLLKKLFTLFFFAFFCMHIYVQKH